MNIAVIYHDADFDGKLSNEVCRHHLRNLHPDAAIHSYGWDYGRPVPSVLLKWWDDQLGDQFSNKWEDYDTIYIVDLSVDELMARHELRDKIIWIDHHKSAIEKWDRKSDVSPGPGLFTGYRIDGVAACRLCWQWFTQYSKGSLMLPEEELNAMRKEAFVNRTVDEPDLIRLAGEYDIWDLRDPDAKALQFGLRSLTADEWDAVIETQFGDANSEDCSYLLNTIEMGYKIKSYCDKQNAEYAAAHSHTIEFCGLTMCALNIGQRGNSDLLLGGIKPEHDACFAWRYDGNLAMVSLYHIAGHEQYDLSKIAVRYGGGGHKGACGFRVNLSVLEQILHGEHWGEFIDGGQP